MAPGMMRRGYYFPRCVRWREIAGLPRKKGVEVDCGCYRVILNSGLTPRSVDATRSRRKVCGFKARISDQNRALWCHEITREGNGSIPAMDH